MGNADGGLQGIWHSGPAQAYMSKAPSGINLKEWPAHDAEWFGVAYWGQLNETTWATYNKDFVSTHFHSAPIPDIYKARQQIGEVRDRH